MFNFMLGLQAAIDREGFDDYEPTLDLLPPSCPLPSHSPSLHPLRATLPLRSPSNTAHAQASIRPPQSTPPPPPPLPIATNPIPASGSSHLPKHKWKPKDKASQAHAPLMEAQVRRRQKKKIKGHENHARCHAEERELNYHPARAVPVRKYVEQAQPLNTNVNVKDVKAKVARTAYVGVNDFRTREDHSWALEDLVGEDSKFKFKLVPWDGKLSTLMAIPLVSADGTLLGVLAGHCDPDDWQRLHQEAVDKLEAARQDSRHPPSANPHRCGKFSTLRCGISYGGGQEQLQNLANSKTNAAVLERLNRLEPFKHLAHFTMSVMATWAPNLHAYYVQHLNALHKHDPTLKPIFPSSVFESSMYNLGPQTVCYKHTDFANLPFGLCGITAFGSYDPKKGGHIILWDCRLVIEFPPGSTILIPSMVVAHSNVPILEGETRYSFTQYTSGQLFHWVENGFESGTSLEDTLSAEELTVCEHRHAMRWKFDLSLLPQFPIEYSEE